MHQQGGGIVGYRIGKHYGLEGGRVNKFNVRREVPRKVAWGEGAKLESNN